MSGEIERMERTNRITKLKCDGGEAMTESVTQEN